MTMNDFEAFARPIAGGQYIAMLRLAHEAEASPILKKGGKPHICPNEGAAYKLITEHLLRFLRGNLVREGEIAGQTAAAANAAFKVGPQRPKTRVITVAYKRGKIRAPQT